MRTEQEMFRTILNFAREEPRIRAVYMNGSRADPEAPRDIHQDYDIVYVVTETQPFLENRDWLKRFGEPAVVQEPDHLDTFLYPEEPHDTSRRYAWLMLFRDHVRIDLTILVTEDAPAAVLSDSLTVVLLDKDGLLPPIPPSTDADYHVQRPTAGQYFACCNEFWWCLNNVGKGVARDELPYALQMLQIVRNMLDKMTGWYIGIHTGFSVSTGKLGKYFKRYLPPDLYVRYLKTYPEADPVRIMQAVQTMTGLFREEAKTVASALGFRYPAEDDAAMEAYLRAVTGD